MDGWAKVFLQVKHVPRSLWLCGVIKRFWPL